MTDSPSATGLRIPVSASPNRRYPGAVILAFVDPCPMCGRRHHHGHATTEPNPDGTYGTRVPHCPFMTDGVYTLVPAVAS